MRKRIRTFRVTEQSLRARELAWRLMAQYGLHNWFFAFNARKKQLGLTWEDKRIIALSYHLCGPQPDRGGGRHDPARNRPCLGRRIARPRRDLAGQGPRAEGRAVGKVFDLCYADGAVAGSLSWLFHRVSSPPAAEAADRVALPDVWAAARDLIWQDDRVA